jgi:hypothetical protein
MPFVVIRYGEDERSVINSDCATSIFNSHLAKISGHPPPFELGTEGGVLAGISDPAVTNVSSKLTDRGVYVLTKILGELAAVSC